MTRPETELPTAVARWLADPALAARLAAQCERLVVGPRLVVRHALNAYVAALEGDTTLTPLRDDGPATGRGTPGEGR